MTSLPQAAIAKVSGRPGNRMRVTSPTNCRPSVDTNPVNGPVAVTVEPKGCE